MEQNNCSTSNRRKHTHLTEKERFKIEGLLDGGKSAKEIALLLERDRSTIYREITRGTIERLKINGSWMGRVKKYRANVAQADCIKRCRNRERSLKIGKDRRLEEYIRIKITQERFSPDAVIGQIKANGLKFERMICTKTLYNYIDSGIFSGISTKDLWEKRKQKKRKYKTVVRVTIKNRRAQSIEERPQRINDRSEYGNWEGDTIKGCRGSKAALLTLTERKTRQEIIIKLSQATHEAVQSAIDRLEAKLGDQFKIQFKSITFDNGSEFLSWESLQASILKEGTKRTTIYFAHSYSSWERGTNENHNRMIRRFIFKGLDIEGFSDEEIKKIENWMNNYPRKILGYNTPNQETENCLRGNSGPELPIVAV